MNILFSTVGRRGYLVKFFREVLGPDDKIFGADNSPYAPGLVYCDHRTRFPKVTAPEYVGVVLDYCVKHKIDIVIPLLDPELEVLAAVKGQFGGEGIMVVISPPNTVEIAFDKYRTCEFGQQNGIAVPQTVLSPDEATERIAQNSLAWPLVVKDRKGSASMNITYCDDSPQLEAAFETCPNPIIQEVLDGDEYGYDLFGGLDFQPISVFCKKKLVMRAGETDKALSTDNPVLIEFGEKILKNLSIFGPCDVDVFLTKDGPKLLEINPRFGGGYPCSHLAGADFCNKIIAMRNDEPLTPDIGSCPDGVCMLKQDEIIRPDWPLETGKNL